MKRLKQYETDVHKINISHVSNSLQFLNYMKWRAKRDGIYHANDGSLLSFESKYAFYEWKQGDQEMQNESWINDLQRFQIRQLENEHQTKTTNRLIIVSYLPTTLPRNKTPRQRTIEDMEAYALYGRMRMSNCHHINILFISLEPFLSYGRRVSKRLYRSMGDVLIVLSDSSFKKKEIDVTKAQQNFDVYSNDWFIVINDQKTHETMLIDLH